MSKKLYWVDISCFGIEAESYEEAGKMAEEQMKNGEGEICNIELQDLIEDICLESKG